VTGSEFDDQITAPDASIEIDGAGGNDQLGGSIHADSLIGGAGDDVLIGGQGDDVLTGGTGADIFFFTLDDPAASQPGDGTDLITDFEAGIDQIWFYGPEFDPLAASSQVGADVVIDLGAGNSVTLANTDLASLTAGDFFFYVPEIPDPPSLPPLF